MSAQVSDMTSELCREVRDGHVLYGREMRTLARSERQDDVLYEDIETGELWVVHLTWPHNDSPPWPMVRKITDLTELADDIEEVEDLK